MSLGNANEPPSQPPGPLGAMRLDSGASGQRRPAPSWGQRAKNYIFSWDMYAYTPTLLDSRFQTIASVVVSLGVMVVFLFTICYTSYTWMFTNVTMMEAYTYHTEGIALLQKPDASDPLQSRLPKIGYRIKANGNSVLNNSSFVKIDVLQQVRCPQNPQNQLKYNSSLGLQYGGNFINKVSGITNFVNETINVDYDFAKAQKPSPYDPCKSGYNYTIPRISGHYYSTDFSYIQAYITANASHPSVLDGSLYPSGSVELFLQFQYTSAKALVEGNFPTEEQLIWSRKVGLAARQTIRWEVTLRVRQLSADS